MIPALQGSQVDQMDESTFTYKHGWYESIVFHTPASFDLLKKAVLILQDVKYHCKGIQFHWVLWTVILIYKLSDLISSSCLYMLQCEYILVELGCSKNK